MQSHGLGGQEGWNTKKDCRLSAPEQVFDSTGESLSGRLAINSSEALNNVGIEVSPEVLQYMYQQFVGGAGRSVQRATETIQATATGNEPEANDLFFINRFLKERDAEAVDRNVRSKAED